MRIQFISFTTPETDTNGPSELGYTCPLRLTYVSAGLTLLHCIKLLLQRDIIVTSVIYTGTMDTFVGGVNTSPKNDEHQISYLAHIAVSFQQVRYRT